MLQGLAGEKREEALLGSAATYFLYERAGTNPAIDTSPLPTPAPAESLRPCSPRSRQHLTRLLDLKYWEILQEWLEAANRAGKHAPEEKLPELLDLVENLSSFTTTIEAVLGERGRWLAAQNPTWALLAGIDSAPARETWEIGSRARRVSFLKRLRASDSAQARELLQETWSGEGAEQRAALLNTFEQGLSLDDEPFLEEKLDDRSKEVRRVAADLLVKLPGSALVGRMIERADRVVSYDLRRKLLLNFGANRKTALQMTSFETADAAMIRDGIEPKSGSRTMGDKAWILYQLIAAIPPAYWLEAWQANPAALFKEAAESEWAEALVRGWRDSLSRYPNGTWAEAFIRYWLSKDRSRLADSFQPTYSGLTYPQFEEMVFEAFQKDKELLYDRHPAVELLMGYKNSQWRPNLVRAVVKKLHECINSENAYQGRVQKGVLGALARHTPPEMADELADGWPEDSPNWPNWSRGVKEFLSLLQLRKDMLKEISR